MCGSRPRPGPSRSEVAVVGDAGRLAALAVFGPGLGQVELTVDQGVAARGGVGGEDADLAVLGSSGGAGVLALHSGGGGALLHEAGVINDQHLRAPPGHHRPAASTDDPQQALPLVVSISRTRTRSATRTA